MPEAKAQLVAQAAELRLLAERLLEINTDARRMAEELCQTISGIVNAQCQAADERAQAILDALGPFESL
jgi:hypothetical protein